MVKNIGNREVSVMALFEMCIWDVFGFIVGRLPIILN
jgi:hypothetical protein